jgi:iron complex transport system substrate-binding protein
VSSFRVVSLLPGATEILHALGLGNLQVGRSHECDFPLTVSSLSVCTRPTFDVNGSSAEIDRLVKDKLSSAASIYQIDCAAMRNLTPTHVLTQTLCDVCAVSFADVQSAFNGEHGLKAEVISLSAGSLQGAWADIRRVAASLGESGAGESLVTSLRMRMEAIERRAAQTSLRPRVAAIEWTQPLMAAGNWVPELIVKAGAENLFGTAGEHSPWMNWDDLRAADPDVVAGMPCGFDLARTRREMAALVALPGWSGLKAARTGRVYICDGNQFMNRPGPRLVESLQILAEILHPELFDPTLQGTGWERY